MIALPRSTRKARSKANRGKSKSQQMAQSELIDLTESDDHNAKGFVLAQIVGGELHIDDSVMSADELKVRFEEMSDDERSIVVPIPVSVKVPIFTAYNTVMFEYDRADHEARHGF